MGLLVFFAAMGCGRLDSAGLGETFDVLDVGSDVADDTVAPPDSGIDSVADSRPIFETSSETATDTAPADTRVETDAPVDVGPICPVGFIGFLALPGYTVGTNPVAVSVDDLDADGRKDIVVASAGGNSVSVLLGAASGFAAAVTYPAGSQPSALALADLDGDGHVDVIIASRSGGVSVLLNAGGGTLGTAKSYPVGTEPVAVAIGDLNGDSKLDIVVADKSSNVVGVLLNLGSGTFSAATLTSTASTLPSGLVVTDATGDGVLDVVVAGRGSDCATLLEGVGDGTLAAAKNYAAGTTPVSVIAADFDRDGKQDAVFGDYSVGRVTRLIGTGAGFSPAGAPPLEYVTGAEPTGLAAGDFNGDGKTDVAVANNGAKSVTVMLGNGDGTFDTSSFAAGNQPLSIAAGTLIGDDKPDLVVTNFADSRVTVLVNCGF